MTILDQLAGHARKRVAASKSVVSLEDLCRQALSLPKGDFGVEKALRKDGLSFICECKPARHPRGSSPRSSPISRLPWTMRRRGRCHLSAHRV